MDTAMVSNQDMHQDLNMGMNMAIGMDIDPSHESEHGNGHGHYHTHREQPGTWTLRHPWPQHRTRTRSLFHLAQVEQSHQLHRIHI